MTDNRNVILAIVLSMIVLFGWQFFVAGPRMERAQRQAQLTAEQQAAVDSALATPGTANQAVTALAATDMPAFATHEEALAASPRVMIDTPVLEGSINLVGARIDDLRLKKYREAVETEAAIITLLIPSGLPNAYFAEGGWVSATGASIAVPTAQTIWTVEGDNSILNATTPITLVWDNGTGLVFRRTISVDEFYLFKINQTVENKTGGDIALYPYARVIRHDTPHVQNFFIQHEGPHGVLGTNNLISRKYSDLQDDRQLTYENTAGWLGFSDKYWTTAVMPPAGTTLNARFNWTNTSGRDDYQTSYVETTPVVITPGTTATRESYLFAGAKEEAVISKYQDEYGFDRFELLIDWGWFHFLTKPMYYLLSFLYGILGNFGLAVLAVTVIVKAIFFPLANRSYASMAAMRRVQPEMQAIQERFKDDRPAQQQAMMELYRKEKINPLSGCWPVLLQIPVFFSLYTVIFISLDMRHAPFFGWIQDLAAPDPTNVFTLFGLIPWEPSVIPVLGSFLHLGFWPLIMGLTMWVQMKLNPPPADPAQAMIFNWMPVLFTFMLGTFPAGLVIYWAWNNTLSVAQQWFIMKRHGVEVDLLGNILNSLKRKPKSVTTDP